MVLLSTEEVRELFQDMEHTKARILISMKRYLTKYQVEEKYNLFEVAYNDLIKDLKRDKVSPSVDLAVYQQDLLHMFLVIYLNRISEQRMIYMFLEVMDRVEPYYVRRFVVNEAN
ncbi:hypothetical protein [Alkalibacillus haloalkaliphilus]|uniref:hypothetical protein n=1 Tax=Alkalibacillus haloalkaliphilus TaxID=94136 RepID=UPI0002F65940|nr:hypothetical protein [Alkalibacillus haloalkaliphilus]